MYCFINHAITADNYLPDGSIINFWDFPADKWITSKKTEASMSFSSVITAYWKESLEIYSAISCKSIKALVVQTILTIGPVFS